MTIHRESYRDGRSGHPDRTPYTPLCQALNNIAEAIPFWHLVDPINKKTPALVEDRGTTSPSIPASPQYSGSGSSPVG